jgi:ATP-dependent Clp protease ATP-binding subunit ClpB
VFQTLQPPHLKRILDIELGMVQDRILNSRGEGKFVFKCTPKAKEFLLKEGTDLKYGARHLKRALERYLVYPLSNLVATNQVSLGDLVSVDFDEEKGKLVFAKEESGALIDNWENPDEAAIFEEIFSKNASATKESKTESRVAKPSVAKERRG